MIPPMHLNQMDLAGKTVLEVGSGRGDTTRVLVDLLSKFPGANLIAADFSAAHFPALQEEFAGRVLPVRFICTSALDLDGINAGSIDVLVCNYTLCAVNSRSGQATLALRRFWEALKPGGWLFIEEEFPLGQASSPTQAVWAEKWRILKAALILTMFLPRLFLITLLFLAGACQSGSAAPIPLPSPTSPVSSPFPSPLSPTSTPLPASTPLPSPLSPPLTPTPTPLPVTTLLFTGVIVPARCVQAAIDERGDYDYLYAGVRHLITEADLAVGTLNAALSDYPPRTGCVPTYVLVGGSENADAMARAGFDLMSVATNHIKNCGMSNCGDRAFFDTLENLRRVGILPVGAGQDHAQAVQPVVVSANGVRFGFVSLGQLEPLAFAADDKPGIAVLNEANLRAATAAARQVSDVVIALPHWGPEDVPNPNWSQRELARVAVEAGADLVVGNHTHVVQALQEIEGVMVFYGLGNFIFDQNWARDHMQGVILQVTFEGSRYAGYELIPTHVDFDGTVHLAGPQEAAEILERIEGASRLLP